MRRRILAVLADGPLTVPEIAAALERPTHEVMFWVMGLRKYGWLAEIKEVNDDGYFRYRSGGEGGLMTALVNPGLATDWRAPTSSTPTPA